MRVHEATLAFKVVRDGPVEALDTPAKIAEYIRDAFEGDPTVEWFICIPLNRKNMPFGRVLISKGSASSCLISPREVLRPCILSNATALVVAHNHPSGDTAPSRADIQITRQLRDTAKTMGIDLLDHVIIGDPDSEIYSFNEAGLV